MTLETADTLVLCSAWVAAVAGVVIVCMIARPRWRQHDRCLRTFITLASAASLVASALAWRLLDLP